MPQSSIEQGAEVLKEWALKKLEASSNSKVTCPGVSDIIFYNSRPGDGGALSIWSDNHLLTGYQFIFRPLDPEHQEVFGPTRGLKSDVLTRGSNHGEGLARFSETAR